MWFMDIMIIGIDIIEDICHLHQGGQFMFVHHQEIPIIQFGFNIHHIDKNIMDLEI